MAAAPIRIRSRSDHGLTEVLLLMPHSMETGVRRDESGALIAPHYITGVEVTIEGRLVFEARMSQAVSRDPLLSLRWRGGKPGDRIEVQWIDSRGERRTDEALIA